MGSYTIWVLWMKKDNYRKWTVEMKIKLFKILCSLPDMVNSWWKQAPFDQIFSKKPFATGAPPQTPLREIPLDPLLKNCVAPLTLRSKSIGHFDCCPIREKVKQNSLYKKSNIIDYQYNPILFIFLSWHAKYFVHSNVWILARDAEKVRHPWSKHYS